jgi:hypothetical protein
MEEEDEDDARKQVHDGKCVRREFRCCDRTRITVDSKFFVGKRFTTVRVGQEVIKTKFEDLQKFERGWLEGYKSKNCRYEKV